MIGGEGREYTTGGEGGSRRLGVREGEEKK